MQQAAGGGASSGANDSGTVSTKSRPLSIDIDNANDAPARELGTLGDEDDMADMEDLALSPAASTASLDDQAQLMPLSMTDSASGSRPLPSLHAPLTFRDVPFSVLYVVHVLFVLLAAGAIRSDEEAAEIDAAAGSSSASAATLSVDDVGIKLRSICVVNVLFAAGWLLLFIFYSKLRFVQGSCVFSIAGLTMLGAEFFMLDNSDALFLGVVVVGFAALELLWSVKVKSGFDFVAVFFELVVEFLVMHPALGYVTCAILAGYTIWASWIATTISYVGHGASPWGFATLFLYFHFYWTSNVFKNVLTIVASGATMLWYYRDDSSDISPQLRASVSDHDSPSDESANNSSSSGSFRFKMDRRVVLHYLRRALTTSFGSICVGSLLCPIAHLMWNVLRWARRDESVLSRRFISLHSEQAAHFIRTYHKYSFVHIAGYGTPFYVAAHDAWALIETHGVEAIVDDDLTSRILLLGGNGWASVMCAMTVSAFASGTPHTVFFALASFAISYTTLSIATQVIAAVIKTLFVCFAESPGRLSQLHPLIYHRFVRLAELKSFRDHKAPTSPGL